MKKILMLMAAGFILQATPVLAESHHGEGGKNKDHKSKMFEKHDTNGDGAISEDEFLAHAKEKFTKMDANGDGSISKEEGKAAHEAKREKMKEMKKKHKEHHDSKEEHSDTAGE